jgi:hypothetical protein
VRRGIAILLAILFSGMLIVPTLASSTGPDVPPCCQKAGKHHCMRHKAEAASGTTGDAVSAITAKCPWYPHSLSVACDPQVVLPSTGAAIFADIIRHAATAPQAEAAARISFHRSNQKRGPPSPVLS